MSSLYSPLSDLPNDHILHTFTTIKALQNAAEDILDKLDRSENQGNQYLVVLGLTKPACARLADDDPRLGSIPYRITLNGSVGIIKLIPSWSHQAVTSDLQQQFQRILTTMGVPFSDYAWRRSAIYTGLSSSTQKEPDECLIPGSRMPTGSTQGWPTLVIETGISESLPRLRNDANWWFNNSSGAVRIVLVIAVSKARKEIAIEKWQLLQSNTPIPVTRATLNHIRQQLPAPMPPRVHQAERNQRSYDAQVAKMAADNMTGAPLVLPFPALLDRPPRGNEADIVLGETELRYCMRVLF